MNKVAIVGAGQLGQMLGEAAGSIDAECRFLDPSASPPAASTGTVIRRDYDDAQGLKELAEWADVLTYEFENVPVAAVEPLTERLPVYPPPAALRKAQDRLEEKSLFEALDIPTSPFLRIDSPDDAQAAADQLGLPLVFKSRRFGYDGKGQAVVHDANAVADVWQELGSVGLIAEKFVAFDREVSIIGARRPGGEIATYPLAENKHSNGILRTSLAPYNDRELHELACDYHARLLEHLDYVGTLSLELFVTGDRLVANEFAPRVHNSGHWTIEGAATSQFENHLRAVLDLPLGPTDVTGHSVMVNLIGSLPAGLEALRGSQTYVHDYGKSPRPGRKLGHITAVADNPQGRDQARQALEEAVRSGE